jgi:hypothetical protein
MDVMRDSEIISTYTYAIDGAEHRIPTRSNATKQYKALLEGNTLHISGVMISPTRPQAAYHNTLSLSSDGKILTYTLRPWNPRTANFAPGRSFVFEKK